MTNEELVALIKKHPIGFGCAALSLALGVALYLRSDAIPNAETERAEQSALAERVTLNITNSARLKEQLDELVAANKVIEARAVRASQLAANYGLLQKLVKDSGVVPIDLRQTTPGTVPKPTKGTYVPIGFAVSVQGELPQLLNFLRAVESGAHYSRVLTANLSTNPLKRGGPLTLALTLEFIGLP